MGGLPLDRNWNTASTGKATSSSVRPTDGSRNPGVAAGPGNSADEMQFVIDCAGPTLAALPSGAAAAEVVATASTNAQIVERNTYRNDAAGGWRMTQPVKRLDARRPNYAHPSKTQATH